MNKKVYFAGSIRGGRNDADLYKRLIEYINRTDRVLTEHVGDLSLSALEGEQDRETQIYLRDTAWIKECDLLVAECTSPSHGVGYELAFAEKLGKPCYIFYDKSRAKLSAMLKGDPYYAVFPYKDESGIYPVIDSILK